MITYAQAQQLAPGRSQVRVMSGTRDGAIAIPAGWYTVSDYPGRLGKDYVEIVCGGLIVSVILTNVSLT